MNQLYELIQTIKNSGSRGQELMKDSFVIGYQFGIKKIKTQDQLQKFVKQLNDLKIKIDQDENSPTRDKFLFESIDNFSIPQKKEQNEQKKKKNTEQKQPGKGKQKNLLKTTPNNLENDKKDSIDFQQSTQEEQQIEKQQNQQNIKKSCAQQCQKSQEGVQTRHQAAQSKADQQKNE
ncbi:unnamed protein product [Paramecium sonneborni]|uniref:Uncharacterized protein n=1 Tax=Paramecium sonneborni TaxID=65129 RepID=A0A8S1K8W6_9CILI|nr:unnamed protein product [Paramecium sonneborni]